MILRQLSKDDRKCFVLCVTWNHDNQEKSLLSLFTWQFQKFLELSKHSNSVALDWTHGFCLKTC